MNGDRVMSVTQAAVKPAVIEEEFSGNKRLLRAWETHLLAVLCVTFTLFHLFVLNVYSLEPLLFRAIHVGWGGAIGFMFYAATKRNDGAGVPWYDWILVIASIACAVYIAVELDGLLFRAGAQFTNADVVVGVVGTLLILEFSRRAAGAALPWCLLFTALWGRGCPVCCGTRALAWTGSLPTSTANTACLA
jgi:TRAP-type uncharacterized transport system fused permease subunit